MPLTPAQEGAGSSAVPCPAAINPSRDLQVVALVHDATALPRAVVAPPGESRRDDPRGVDEDVEVDAGPPLERMSEGKGHDERDLDQCDRRQQPGVGEAERVVGSGDPVDQGDVGPARGHLGGRSGGVDRAHGDAHRGPIDAELSEGGGDQPRRGQGAHGHGELRRLLVQMGELAAGHVQALQDARRVLGQPLAGGGGPHRAPLEFARNVCGLAAVAHAELHPDASALLLVPLQCKLFGEEATVTIAPGTPAAAAMGAGPTTERYFCRYGLNADYVAILQAHGLVISGRDDLGDARVVELPGHPFFVGSLFQPELSSDATCAHPLIAAFAATVRDHAACAVGAPG